MKDETGILLSGLNERVVPTYENFLPLQPKYVVRAQSVGDVQRAIVEAGAAGLRIRPMGAGQSWAPHLLTSDVCLATGGLNRIHAIDRTLKTITVDAGVTLGEATQALGAHGLSLPSLSFLPQVTMGGAIATATHGTSHKWGTLSDSVRSMELILASGELKRLGPESPPDEMRAARVAIGMLGVITRLEIEVVDMPWVRFSRLEMDLAGFLRGLQSLQAKYDHIWVHWELGSDRVTADCLETHNGPRKGFHPYADDQERRWEPLSLPMSMLAGPFRRAARGVLNVVRSTKDRISGAEPLPQDENEIRTSMQYGAPASDLDSYVAFIKASGVDAEFPGRDLEMKFLKGSDRSLLGPNADGDAVLFNLYWMVPKDKRFTVVDRFENLMRSKNSKPHWGKYHEVPDVAYMESAYRQWSKFESVRRRFDPSGMFATITRSSPAKRPETLLETYVAATD